MSQQPVRTIDELTARVKALEEKVGQVDSASNGFGRIYAAIATFSLLITFFPWLERVEDDRSVTPWPAFWDYNFNNSIAQLGMILLIFFLACLVFAAFRPPRWAGMPVTIAILAAVVTLMVMTKAGTSEPTPELTAAGTWCVIIGFATILVAVANVLHLRTPKLADDELADRIRRQVG